MQMHIAYSVMVSQDANALGHTVSCFHMMQMHQGIYSVKISHHVN